MALSSFCATSGNSSSSHQDIGLKMGGYEALDVQFQPKVWLLCVNLHITSGS